MECFVVQREWGSVGCVCGHGGLSARDGRNQFDLVVVSKGVLLVLTAWHKLQINGCRKRRLNPCDGHGIGQGGSVRQGVRRLVDENLEGGVRHAQTSIEIVVPRRWCGVVPTPSPRPAWPEKLRSHDGTNR